jgi:hypothetical protein
MRAFFLEIQMAKWQAGRKMAKWKRVGHKFKTSEFFLRQDEATITPELRVRMEKIAKEALAKIWYPY